MLKKIWEKWKREGGKMEKTIKKRRKMRNVRGKRIDKKAEVLFFGEGFIKM